MEADAEDEDSAAVGASVEEARRVTEAGPAAGRPRTAKQRVGVAGAAMAAAGKASVTRWPWQPPWAR